MKAHFFLQFGLRGIGGQGTQVEDTGNDLEVVVSMEKTEEQKEEEEEEEGRGGQGEEEV